MPAKVEEANDAIGNLQKLNRRDKAILAAVPDDDHPDLHECRRVLSQSVAISQEMLEQLWDHC